MIGALAHLIAHGWYLDMRRGLLYVEVLLSLNSSSNWLLHIQRGHIGRLAWMPFAHIMYRRYADDYGSYTYGTAIRLVPRGNQLIDENSDSLPNRNVRVFQGLLPLHTAK